MSINVDDLEVMSFEKAAVIAGYSTKHLERLVKAGVGPKVTKVGPRRRGVRVDHMREWIESCASDLREGANDE